MSINLDSITCDHCGKDIINGGFVVWLNTKLYTFHNECVKIFERDFDLCWIRQGLAEFLQDTVNRLKRGEL